MGCTRLRRRCFRDTAVETMEPIRMMQITRVVKRDDTCESSCRRSRIQEVYNQPVAKRLHGKEDPGERCIEARGEAAAKAQGCLAEPTQLSCSTSLLGPGTLL